MGRAMLIICSGVLVLLGFMGMNTARQGLQLTEKSSLYARTVHAKNAAHTAIQIAMNEINQDEQWGKNHGSGNPWTTTIDGASTSLYVDYIHDSPDFWEADSIRIVSTATYVDVDDARVISVYLKNPYDQYVSNFKAPLTVATSNFSFTASGSATIDGTDAGAGTCGDGDKPAITVNNEMDQLMAQNEIDNITTVGGVDNDPKLNYQPTDELIARLKNTADVQYLSGSYKGDMGTADNPGVFFVEEPTKLTGGISEGYGILVVRNAGYMSYDSSGVELDIAGNFKFNGLVVFENAYGLDGKGTPTINGSVLVGNTEDYTSSIDININGNITMQYDCRGESYAKKAAALAIKEDKYTRVVTFE